ncbi:MAG: hypothetical protein F6J97_17415 [Leptolyngbya sp. SIO4C1]|nr:hypothetical protein [Leptolyngbya sp. SIO4C1]
MTARSGLPLLLSLGLLSPLAAAGLAAPSADRPAHTIAQQPTSGSFATHTEADAFVIQYPQGWQVNSLDRDSIEIVSPTSEAGSSPEIRTQVALLREAPDAVINRSIDQLVSDQARVGLYRMVTVDRQPAFRIWMSTDADTEVISTFIGYGDFQTAVLTSQYAADTPEAEAVVLQMHDSFVNTGIATAAD